MPSWPDLIHRARLRRVASIAEKAFVARSNVDYARTLIALTTVPERAQEAVHHVLDSLGTLGFEVVLSIPSEYLKFGSFPIPHELSARSDVTVFRPSQDFGPATKLLGALEYAGQERRFDTVITFDDDCWYPDPHLPVSILIAMHAHLPRPTVVTFGGTLLSHSPYRKHNGIVTRTAGFVDAVKGFSGVLYPIAPLAPAVELYGKIVEDCPEARRDDDALIGLICSILEIPIWAVARDLPFIGFSVESLLHAEKSYASAVDALESEDRNDVTARIFGRAVEQSQLPSRFSRKQMMCLCETCVNRRLGRRVRAKLLDLLRRSN